MSLLDWLIVPDSFQEGTAAAPFRRARSADYLNLSLSGDTGADYLDDPLLESLRRSKLDGAQEEQVPEHLWCVLTDPSVRTCTGGTSATQQLSSGDTMKKIVSVPAFSGM